MDPRPLPLPRQLLKLRADVDVEPTLGGVEEHIDVVVVLPRVVTECDICSAARKQHESHGL